MRVHAVLGSAGDGTHRPGCLLLRIDIGDNTRDIRDRPLGSGYCRAFLHPDRAGGVMQDAQ